MNNRANKNLLSVLLRLSTSILFVLCAASVVLSQEGRLVRENLHSASLEKTVTGESSDRSVIVYLPPSYDKSPTKRYPVVYLLHGIVDTNEVWVKEWTKRNDSWGTIQGVMNSGIAERKFGEMIVVMPDEKTKWGGSFYANSSVTSLLKMKTAEEAYKGGFYALGLIVVGQAFSPNPERGPFYFDLPYALVDGRLQPAEPGFSKWLENFPVNMVEKYRSNLAKLRGLKFDSGYEDEFTHIPPTARELSTKLTSLGIEHVFEEYNGDHRNRMWGRTGRVGTEVIPYFWLLLDTRSQ